MRSRRQPHGRRPWRKIDAWWYLVLLRLLLLLLVLVITLALGVCVWAEGCRCWCETVNLQKKPSNASVAVGFGVSMGRFDSEGWTYMCQNRTSLEMGQVIIPIQMCVMPCTVGCLHVSACATKSPPRGYTQRKQDKKDKKRYTLVHLRSHGRYL